MTSLNLSSRFRVVYGSGDVVTEIGVKPSSDNKQIALDILQAAVNAVKGNADPKSKSKDKLTKNNKGNHNYSAGAFSVTGLTEDIIDASVKGRLLQENLEEIPLEIYMSSKRCSVLLAEKEKKMELLPLQIEELKRVLPLIEEREATKPVRENAIAYKDKYMAERETREKLEYEVAELRAALAAK